MPVRERPGEQRGVSLGTPVDRVAPRAQIAEIQRTRLLAAAVRTVEELGYGGATVAHITRRARVSRRTFYEIFANREECLAAVLEDVVDRLQAQLGAAGLQALPWRERLRAGLWEILSFLDGEPALARTCVIQALRGDRLVLERRESILTRLALAIDAGRAHSPRAAEITPLTAEGLVGAAFAIVHGRLLKGERRPLTDLHGELMAMIVLPYLGAAAARREQIRPAPAAHTKRNAGVRATVVNDPLDGVPMRLTYRTARVLEGIADHPGASNRAVAEHAEISDQGQVSKLLARLERIGLLLNAGEGHLKGEPNAWTLTDRGEQVAHSVRMHAPDLTHQAA
jgi:AcrR family transcriptional regulator